LTAEEEFVGRLQRTQWLSPTALAHYQRPLIERLVRHAATQTEFYPPRLEALFDGADPSAAPIDLSKWRSVPTVARADAIHCVDQMKARRVPPDTGGIRQGESSGSTGRKLQHVRSEIADVVTNCMWDRVYELFELDLHARLAFITFDKDGRYPYPTGLKTKEWNHADPEAEVHLLSLATSPADQLEWLERVQPGHVMAYPIGLREVAEVALARGSGLRFETFISTGEVLDDQTREAIERAFHCRTIDIYGVREIGQVAFQCPDATGYHFCSEAVLCELVDERGDLVPPGEYGRVVVTALYNYAMPFIRYETGDYARASALPCACGRGLPSIENIGGRARNLIVMPDGTRKRLPGVFFHHVSRFLSYRQIQIVQDNIQSFEIRYQPDAPTVPDVEGLTRLVREQVHPDAIVILVPVEKIERGTGMKYEQFVTRVSA
jgi:phenylacetate-CoA ligase